MCLSHSRERSSSHRFVIASSDLTRGLRVKLLTWRFMYSYLIGFILISFERPDRHLVELTHKCNTMTEKHLSQEGLHETVGFEKAHFSCEKCRKRSFWTKTELLDPNPPIWSRPRRPTRPRARTRPGPRRAPLRPPGHPKWTPKSTLF